MTPSESLIVALVLLALALAMLIVGVVALLRQKVYYDKTKGSVLTEVEIPFLGKLKTNVPAALICFFALVPMWWAYSLMIQNPELVTFNGEVAVDPEAVGEISAISIGITSALFSRTETPSRASPTVKVAIPVPNSWPSYTAYAFALGGQRTRPALLGVNLADPKFQLRIAP